MPEKIGLFSVLRKNITSTFTRFDLTLSKASPIPKELT
jgi:hypothetical protein